MMKYLIFAIALLCSAFANGQSKSLPQWFTKSFRQQKLDVLYEVKAYIKPSLLEADFNGDGAKDIAVLIIEKRTYKKGILLIYAKTLQHFIFGAGTLLGKKGDDGSDDLKWMDGWKIYKSAKVDEPLFNKDGDILGSVVKKIPNKGISIWANEDGEPLAGGIIYWDGKKFAWIHQGE